MGNWSTDIASTRMCLTAQAATFGVARSPHPTHEYRLASPGLRKACSNHRSALGGEVIL